MIKYKFNDSFKKAILFVFAGVFFFSCHRTTLIQMETFQTETGWGYLLKKDGKIYIKQDQIPAVEGSYSFVSKTDAEKTGRLVLQKLKDHRYPSVTAKELDSLHISFPHHN